MGYYLDHDPDCLAIHLWVRHTDTSMSASDFSALTLTALSYVGTNALGD